jgi:hypothetical protein
MAALFLQRTDVGNQRFYVGTRQLIFMTFHLALAVLDDVRRFGVTETLVFAVIFHPSANLNQEGRMQEIFSS